jgi:predicted RND superfamily exporter protein
MMLSTPQGGPRDDVEDALPSTRWDRWLFVVAVVTLLLLAAATPWVIRAAIGILGVDSTTPIEWVPETFPPREAYATFTREFESGDVVVASWPECTLGAASIERFISAATGPDGPRDAAGQPWFESVVSGDQALERLTSPPLSLDREVAIERLQGVLIGPDGKRTCLVIGLTSEGLEDRRRATAWIRDTLLQTATTVADDLHLAGSVVDNVCVDEASAESLRVYGGPAAAIIFLLTWWSLRSVRYALLVFLLALFCVGLCFASLAAWGDRMNPVLIVMPVLVLTLGVSGGIHVVNYLIEARQNGPVSGVAMRAIRLGWLPCALSAGTTSLGLASLVVSELEPIRVFGFHGAIGVLATLLVLFLVVPGIFSRWPIERRSDDASLLEAESRFASGVVRWAGPIVVIAVVGMAIAAAGVPGIRTSVSIDTLFTRENKVIRDYEWLEREIGPLVPVEVVLRFGETSDIRPSERLDMVREVGAALRKLPGVSGVASAAMFIPESATSSGSRAAVRKAVVARKLESNLAELSDMKIIRDLAGEQLWRITARTSALAGIDYGEFLDRVRACVEPVVADHGGLAHGVRADYSGVMPLINAIQKTLLHDLFTSFLSACVVIALVMMVVERNALAGLIAMIPNVFPMVLLFGLLGWTSAALDIGSVMTASIALGMAVDGTFHFLTFFRRGLVHEAVRGAGTELAGRTAAVHAAFQHSASALVQSAVVCGLGILAFAGSSFAPTRQFAWMLSLLVAAALVGDLILLPALLTSPLGRWFKPRQGPTP